ncbi:NLR family CARD domain-containing protein 4-like [Amphiura filiformis]|uniref:NLR family CARD domain-containing protein 4-like n=1 Tax=Amphiura filiformis TaxID=82378 RepID=UPI003B20B8DA
MDPPLVMISYQWDAQQRMLKLKDELIKAGYKVWMDVDKMQGNLDDRMSEAVEKASVILACFSSKYQMSTSCKKEAQYGDYLKKPIIPLKYEEYQPTGWLGLLINPLLYYDVQTDETMMQELPKIIKDVEQKISVRHEDLASSLTSHVSIRSTSVDFEVCQQELRTFYQQEMGTVQLLPWGDDVIDMDTIFVNLTLAVDGKQSSGGSREDIERVEDMLGLKGRTGQRASRILLRGFAGSGKSTAMAKIAYDWAKNLDSGVSNMFSQFKLLFILSLREIESNETLTDAILDQILPQDTKLSKQDLEDCIKLHSKETLILLDGLDEYPMERLQKKVTGDIESILANKKLRDACVVVATRPEKVEDLGEHQKQYIHVKLSGFSEENVEVYIKKFFQDSQTKAKGLIKALGQSPSIKVLAQIPVMLLMLCLLWSDAQKLPDTHTALYEQAVLYLWKRYRRSADITDKDDDFEEVLLHLGRVALDGLTSDGKLIFLENDFPAQVLEEACKAGLLTKERLRSKLNVCNSISFLHKSVQEYCAAYFWASLADNDVDLFKSYLQRIGDDLQVFAQVELLTFCCGMKKKAASLILPQLMQVFKHRTEESVRIGGITQTADKDIWPLFRMLRESGLKYDIVHSWFEPLFQSKVVEIRQNPHLL